jgi:hypothetical protein
MNKVINVLDYDESICKIANKLSHGDRFLAEELRSEMYITLLTSQIPQCNGEKDDRSKAVHLRELKCRAIDYMRSKARNYSYEGAFRHISLEAMEDSGFQIDTEGKVYLPEEQNSVFVLDNISDPD